MRVAYFVESLPPHLDGISRVMTHLVETLEAEKVEYLLVSPFKDQRPPWRDHVRQVASIPFPLYPEYPFCLPWLSSFEKDLDAFKPDLVHCVANPTPLGFAGLRYAKTRGIPSVTSYQTHYVSYFKYYGMPRFIDDIGWNILRKFHGRCDRTYVPSLSAKKELEQHGIRNTELWGHGVELSSFTPSFRNARLRRSIGAGDLPILFFISRLVKEKDLADLAAADTFLKRWGQRYKLVIGGEGPYKKELMRLLPDTHFPGRLHDRGLSEWYASSDIFVFPSTTETYGLVVQEALASGLPVVAADKGGAADLVKDKKNGFLARPNDPQDLARKIKMLLEDPKLRKRMSKKAPRGLRKDSWAKVNKGLLRSYRNILNHRVTQR
jgi:phosphatidylinositol alpha 1,6-mannosyltransferase